VAKQPTRPRKANERGVRMRRMNRPMIAIVGVAALGALLPACSSNSNTASPRRRPQLRQLQRPQRARPRQRRQRPRHRLHQAVGCGQRYQRCATKRLHHRGPGHGKPGGMIGAAVQFKNQDDTNRIGDTVLILPDAAGATTALNGSLAAVGSSVVVEVRNRSRWRRGTDGCGTSPDKSKAVTVLLFTEGKAFVTLEFDSAPMTPCHPISRKPSLRSRTLLSRRICPTRRVSPGSGSGAALRAARLRGRRSVLDIPAAVRFFAGGRRRCRLAPGSSA